MKKYQVEGFVNQVIAKQTIKTMKDGKGGIDFFLSHLSWMIVLLMPAFAFFLELVNRRYYYVEHVIFSFHCHAFMFFLLSVVFFVKTTLAPSFFNLEWVSSILNVGIGVYLLYYFYKAMRRVYQQGRLKTSLKFSFLLVSYMITLIFAILLTIIGSFFFF